MQDYLSNPKIAVRLNGVGYEHLPDSEKEFVRNTDMNGCIVKRTVHGLLTVNSFDAYRPVAYLGYFKEDQQETPRYNTDRRPTGHYSRGERRYPNQQGRPSQEDRVWNDWKRGY